MGVTDPVAPPPPRSIDVRVWVTRPHIALLEFPMSPNTSALLLEGEQGVYYRWQSLAIAQVRVFDTGRILRGAIGFVGASLLENLTGQTRCIGFSVSFFVGGGVLMSCIAIVCRGASSSFGH